MRPEKKVEEMMRRLREPPRPEAHDRIVNHLLRALKQRTEASPTVLRSRIIRPVKYVASVAAIAALTACLLHTGGAPRERERTTIASANTPRITLLTEISLERAYWQGGIAAVESQSRDALAGSTQEPTNPSLAELLAQLAGDNDDTGGTDL